MHHRPHPQRSAVRGARVLFSLFVPVVVTVLCGGRARGEDFVLLQNGNVIQGTVVPIGSVVLIRNGAGNELKLDARHVAFSASSLSELYNFRVASRQVSDVSSHHDDARWCFRHGLFAQMLEALDAAEAVDPSHPETIRLRRQWQSAAEFSQSVAVPVQEGGTGLSTSVAELPRSWRELPQQHSDDELIDLNVSSDSLAFFTSRVQPILISRCGNSGCHRSPTESSWNLTHMGVQVRPPARMTRLNLVATLKLVNQAEPLESDLLRYAVHPHAGRREPPLRQTDEVALDSLRVWTQQMSLSGSSDYSAPPISPPDFAVTAANVSPSAVIVALPTVARQSPVGQAGYNEEPPLSEAPSISRSAPPGAAARPARSPVSRPTRLPTIDDPFDPNIFNRHYRDEAAVSGSVK